MKTCLVYLLCGKTLTFSFEIGIFLLDKSGQMGHFGTNWTKTDKMDKTGQMGQNWTKWSFWDKSGQKWTKADKIGQMGQKWTNGTGLLDIDKKPPISLGIISQFKFFCHG
jgi:hypothetical protein